MINNTIFIEENSTGYSRVIKIVSDQIKYTKNYSQLPNNVLESLSETNSVFGIVLKKNRIIYEAR